MKKVIEIYYLAHDERTSEYSTGFRFTLDDGTLVEQMSTDVVADKVEPPR